MTDDARLSRSGCRQERAATARRGEPFPPDRTRGRTGPVCGDEGGTGDRKTGRSAA